MHALKFSSFMKKLSNRAGTGTGTGSRRHEGYIRMMDTEKKKKSSTTAPKGFIPVCIGEDRIRYEIPVECLNSMSFKNFMKQHEEEILDTRNDPICLLCSTSAFEGVLNLAKGEAKRRN